MQQSLSDTVPQGPPLGSVRPFRYTRASGELAAVPIKASTWFGSMDLPLTRAVAGYGSTGAGPNASVPRGSIVGTEVRWAARARPDCPQDR